MDLSRWPESFPYLAVFVATILEGEVVFVGASVLVSLGHLDPLRVFAAAALGGSSGDQFFFYVLRGRLRHWLGRCRALTSVQQDLETLVQRHSTSMILACRFLPGLRVAIPAACAYAGIRPLKFSGLSLIGSAAWSGAIFLLVSYLGPQALARLGITAWWVPVVPGAAVIALFIWLRWRPRPRVKN
ncbi:MAG: hypothetical protein EXQ58_11085 [Acidobacteria bacterium]|nr:hypothetical protein [Acidobacteriota bacterium]